MRVAWIRSAPGCADSPPQRCSHSPRCWPSGAAATSGSPGSGWRSSPACCSRSPRSWPKRPLPRSRNGRLALGGLAALTAWTGLSLLWAPVGGPAFADLERLILYTAAFGAGIVLLKGIDWVEPALLVTIVATAAYGLSERLLPTLFELQTLPSAGDRLAHPLTYWNGQGALAALGLVLAAGLASRGHRLAAAAAPIIGLDLYLTLSRGAIGAGLAGPRRAARAPAHQGHAARGAGDRRRRRRWPPWPRSRCPASRTSTAPPVKARR